VTQKEQAVVKQTQLSSVDTVSVGSGAQLYTVRS